MCTGAKRTQMEEGDIPVGRDFPCTITTAAKTSSLSGESRASPQNNGTGNSNEAEMSSQAVNGGDEDADMSLLDTSRWQGWAELENEPV